MTTTTADGRSVCLSVCRDGVHAPAGAAGGTGGCVVWPLMTLG